MEKPNGAPGIRYTETKKYSPRQTLPSTRTKPEALPGHQSGTRQVPNQEVHDLIEEHNELMDRYNQVGAALAEKEDYVARVNGNPNASEWDRSQIVYKQIEIASDRRLLAEWRAKLNDYRARAKSLPQTVAEPVYDNEEYHIIDHVITCSIRWALQAKLHGPEIRLTQWQAETDFKTREVDGNASHGVPVRRPDPAPKAKLMPGLVKDLLREYADSGRTVLMSTHTLQIAEEISDRVAVMKSSKLVFSGPVSQLRELIPETDGHLESLYLALTKD